MHNPKLLQKLIQELMKMPMEHGPEAGHPKAMSMEIELGHGEPDGDEMPGKDPVEHAAKPPKGVPAKHHKMKV